MGSDRFRRIALPLLLLAVAFLALALVWHLVGMDHASEAMVLAACLAILATALAALVAFGASGRRWIAPGEAVAGVPTSSSSSPPRRPRSPPKEGTVLRS
ncbi:MAG TPA: hypothetical protein VNO79_17330 [Actinomycetota bacterium]|nr:hypothetical protein [Actinomycetota bacterium]